jgi:hypothetical protein
MSSGNLSSWLMINVRSSSLVRGRFHDASSKALLNTAELSSTEAVSILLRPFCFYCFMYLFKHKLYEKAIAF